MAAKLKNNVVYTHKIWYLKHEGRQAYIITYQKSTEIHAVEHFLINVH